MNNNQKPFWKSKTIIVNFICLVALIIQSQTSFIITPEEQAALVAVINLILRAITNQGLTIFDN